LKTAVNFFNWDVAEHRKLLLKHIFLGMERLEGENREIIVFDEIHKYPRWKNVLKGLFDSHEPATHWIVTGSAMLNVRRRGQDSLLGRHFTYNLAPFSVAEILSTNRLAEIPQPEDLTEDRFESSAPEVREAFETLDRFSGFPEPLFKTDSSFLKRWRSSRLDRLLNQDLAATENLRHLPLVEQLMYLLPDRVGSPLSLNSLREDLELHFQTVKHWMQLLERVFYGFFVKPYSKQKTRMLRKEAKWYLWDWTEIEDPGARFENLMAVHLLKYVNYVNDLGLGDLSLHYVRDKEKREVDFLICSKKKPALLVECKAGGGDPNPALGHFARLLGLKRAFQVTLENSEIRVFRDADVKVCRLPAHLLLKELV
jgi:predicted AAA+ superfamily ATPase